MAKRVQKKAKRDKVIGQIVAYLHKNNVNKWPIQDKGVLVAAIKEQITERS